MRITHISIITSATLQYKFRNLTYKMDMNEKQAITDAMSILKAEPSSDSDHREQLAVLVASVKAKDMIGVSLTRDQVKRLS